MRRRHLLVCTAAVAAVCPTGCTDLGPGGDPEGDGPTGGASDEVTTRDEPTDEGADESTATDEPTAAGRDREHPMNRPDPDLGITVTNRHDEPHGVSITVARESGAVVYRADHDLDPGAEYEAYDLQEAGPDGVERFTVAVETGGRRESIRVETSECYGLVEVGVDAEGEPFATYAVC